MTNGYGSVDESGGSVMRRTLIPIAVGVGLGVFVSAFLAYFTVQKQSIYWVDGLGRPLATAPWLALLIFGTNKQWAGWTWFFLDFAWFWGGMALAFFLLSLARKARNHVDVPKLLITIAGISITLGAAYLTQRSIKMGVALGLEAGIGYHPRMVAVSPTEKVDLPFVKYRQWSRFTDREKDIYIQSLLETWSFVLYGLTDAQKSTHDFSTFTTCVENEKLSGFKTYVIEIGYVFGKMDKAPVVHLFNNAAILCNKYANKGDGSLRPVRLVQKNNWEKFNDRERIIYLMGYIDFAHFSEQRFLILASKEQSTLDEATSRFLEEKKANLQRLANCLGNNGITAVFNAISSQPIEWKYPLPWSVATALGKTCFPTE